MKRVALIVIAMTRAATASPAPIATAPAPGDRPTYSLAPARLTDGSRVALPPMAISANHSEVDRRPIYLGGGLVVMAAVLLWNRRRRERWERDDATARGEPSPGDDDGDDLHAAARGVAKPVREDEP